MQLTLILILIVVLAIIVFQDLKYREVHVLVLAAIFLVACGINYFETYLGIRDIAYNIAFIAINILGVMAYMSIKEKTFFNPIDKAIGLGDIVFFIAITPLFQTRKFILFFTLGLICSLLIFVATKKIRKHDTIPLAGYLSLVLLACIGLKAFNIVNPFFFEF